MNPAIVTPESLTSTDTTVRTPSARSAVVVPPPVAGASQAYGLVPACQARTCPRPHQTATTTSASVQARAAAMTGFDTKGPTSAYALRPSTPMAEPSAT